MFTLKQLKSKKEWRATRIVPAFTETDRENLIFNVLESAKQQGFVEKDIKMTDSVIYVGHHFVRIPTVTTGIMVGTLKVRSKDCVFIGDEDGMERYMSMPKAAEMTEKGFSVETFSGERKYYELL